MKRCVHFIVALGRTKEQRQENDDSPLQIAAAWCEYVVVEQVYMELIFKGKRAF